LPTTSIPTVEVGGYRGTKKAIDTWSFLRTLSNYFSYITAVTYWNSNKRNKEQIIIDDFQGKTTKAWANFIDSVTPIVYPHGDGCNIYISTADMIASLTDKKICDNHLRLNEEDIRRIWA
jgi:hypothetical protein